MKRKIAILFGGQSTEHDVSRVSATSVLKHIDVEKYEIYPIGITKDGNWFKYNGKYHNIENGSWETDRENLENHAEKYIFDRRVDVVFPVLHGMNGEDGTIQGLCKLKQIPCVGPGVMSSSICMDKIYTKYVLENFGIKQAEYHVVLRSNYNDNGEKEISEIERKLNYPVFVKPSNSGSSVGITKAHNREELILGLKKALELDRKILVERGINAREIEVAVLGNDRPKASVAGEIIPCKEFYDYEAKYANQDSELLIPARLNEEDTVSIRKMAVEIYTMLDCAGMARVDFLVDKDNGMIYLNEINTIPGFTNISMYPKLWDATGLEYSKLIDELIELAVERNNN